MPKMIGNREDFVIHRSGHAIAFAPGVEVFVPEDSSLVKECINRGHQLVKESAPKEASVAEEASARPVVKKG